MATAVQAGFAAVKPLLGCFPGAGLLLLWGIIYLRCGAGPHLPREPDVIY